MIGQTLSRYKIISKLGEGGMGEVYLAEDTELGREVAIKVLPPALAEDPKRLERFRREARAVAALDHPNIVTIFNVEEAAGRRLLVMEHVDGRSLDRLIPERGMPLEKVFEIAVPLADALAAAHDKGITHRDLKPANVMVTADGTVKVLDFGLAKLALEAEAAVLPGDGATEAATRTATLTGEGTVMGTAPYMSPEQLSGKPADHRSDIFSLGIVLYEMVAGKRPFQGETGIELASSILKDSPSSVTDVRDDLPRHLGRIIQHCLEKDPERRFQSAKDIRNEIQGLEREVTSGEVELVSSADVDTASPARSAVPVGRLIAAVAFVLVAIVGAVWWTRAPEREAPDTEMAELAAHTVSSQPTFAVLPFRNLGADAALDYLSLAVPDEVTTTLSRAPGLEVRPFSMTAGLNAPTLDPIATGNDLGVGHVVTGQYLQEGDRLSLTLEAIDVDRKVAVWRQSFVVGSHELMSLRQQVAATVETELLPAIGAASARVAGTRPTSEAAYDFYLQSLPLSTEREPNQRGIALLEQALSLDDSYAPAWNQLAVRYYHRGAYYGGGAPDYDRSVDAAGRALELDPELVEPAMRIIIVEVERGRLNEAYDAAQQLVTRRPDAARAHFVRSYVFRYAGALDRARRDCDTAVALDPHNPGFRSCGITNSLARHYDRALEFLALDADSTFSIDNSAVVRMRQGKRAEAADLFRRSSADWAPYIAALEGEPLSDETIETIVENILLLSDGEQPYWTGANLAYFGAHEAALDLIAESVERGYCSYPFMETDPLLASLRNDPAIADRYARVRDAGKACHEAFLAHISTS